MTQNREGLAYAKINLSLDVVGKLDDGYHALETVMQTVNLCDEITIKCSKGSDITVDTRLPYIPNDARNIACKAAKAFFAYTKITGYGVQINIVKKIPICAGLGGGSADAACVLRILNEMFETALGREELERLAFELGADVPFCIEGGTKFAQGRGEILTDLKPLPESYVLICKPAFSCSTPELFKRIDLKKIGARPDTQGLHKAIDDGDINGIARRLYNVFEDFLPYGSEEMDSIKDVMLERGALGVSMTGSGPTVFGIFDSKISASEARAGLALSYKDCFVTIPTYCQNQGAQGQRPRRLQKAAIKDGGDIAL